MKKTYAVRFAAIIYLLVGLNCGAQEAVQNASTQSVVVTGQKKVSKWFRAESQHFNVYSDTSREDVAQLLTNLERLDYLLRIYTKSYNKTGNSEQKLTLYYHERVGSFNQIDADHPADAIGLYNSCTAGVQGFGVQEERIAEIHNEQLVKHPLNESLSHLFEAYARHFLYRHTDIRSPTAFIDGFAQYFSSVRFSDNQMVIGRTPTAVGNYLNFLENGHRYSLDYKDILEQSDPQGRNYAGNAGVKLEFEAKSWILTHYMFSSEDSIDRMADYLNSVYHDVPPAQAFEKAFGLKVADLANAMWKYRLRSAHVLQVNMPSLPMVSIDFNSLPQSASDFILADAILKSCPDQHEGKLLLRRLGSEASEFRGSEFAQLTLSRAQIDWGNPQDALPYLTKAVQKDSASFDALYLLGLANLRLAEQHGDASQQVYLDASQRNLLRARDLNHNSTEVALAYLKSDILAKGEPETPALEGIISAWREARDVPALARSAALSYAYLGNTSGANNALKSMINNSRAPVMAEWAKKWKSNFDSGLSRNEILAEMRVDPTSDAAFKEWTIANESVMQVVEYNAGLESAQYVIDQMAHDPHPDKALNMVPVKK